MYSPVAHTESCHPCCCTQCSSGTAKRSCPWAAGEHQLLLWPLSPSRVSSAAFQLTFLVTQMTLLNRTLTITSDPARVYLLFMKVISLFPSCGFFVSVWVFVCLVGFGWGFFCLFVVFCLCAVFWCFGGVICLFLFFVFCFGSFVGLGFWFFFFNCKIEVGWELLTFQKEREKYEVHTSISDCSVHLQALSDLFNSSCLNIHQQY